MGLLDQIASAFGGGNAQDQMQAMAAGQGNLADTNSPVQGGLAAMLTHAPPGALSDIFSKVAGQMDPQAYANHVTPGVNGTNPLGGLAPGALSLIASALVSKLTGPGGYSASSLMSRIPGLGTTEPSQMDPAQVAQVAQYTQENHPDLFGQAAAQVGQHTPGLLQSLLGNSALSQGAAALASHYLQHAT